MGRYRILSLDGGGIRGIVSVVLMQRISEVYPSWLDKADLLAGTSTGGLIALGLAEGKTLDQLKSLYVEKGKIIFDDSWLDDLKDIGKSIGSDYSIENLEKVLKEELSNTKLKDLLKKVLIPTFCLDRNIEVGREKRNVRTWSPKIFHNFEGEDSDGDEYVYKAGLYTSAAPTYFESVDSYIDGGVFANNPSMIALAQTQDIRSFDKAIPFEEISLLSVGTGYSGTFIKGKKLDWGYAQWAQPLVSLMLDGVSGIADYQCSQILKEGYKRLNILFPEKTVIGMDEFERIDEMINLAMGADISETLDFIGNKWMKEK